MKKISISLNMRMLSILLLTTVSFSFAQRLANCSDDVQNEFIDSIQGFQPTELIPYYDPKLQKWGIIHKTNKNILVEPVFKKMQVFKPNMTAHLYGYRSCKLNIKYSNGEYAVFTPINEPIRPPRPVFPVYKTSRIVKDIEGFEVSEAGEITGANEMFVNIISTASSKCHLKIQQVFELQGTYYGVVRLEEDSFSIYSDKGVIVEGFEDLTEWPLIGGSYEDSKDLWVLVKGGAGKYVFKSLIKQKVVKVNSDEVNCWDCVGRDFFGYQILKVNGETGLFDLFKMKWKIKPSENNKFSSIFYTSSVKIVKPESLKQLKQNRKLAGIYLLTSEKVVVDLKGNSILPE